MAVWVSLVDPFSDYLHTPRLVLCCSDSCPVSRSLVFQLPSLHGPGSFFHIMYQSGSNRRDWENDIPIGIVDSFYKWETAGATEGFLMHTWE